MRTVLASIILGIILASTIGVSAAQEPTQDGYVSKSEYEKLKREVEALREEMRALRTQRSQPQPRSAEKAPETEKPPATAATPAEALPPRTTLKPGDREEEAKEARRQLELFMREQRLLFRRGELQVELATSYSLDTSERSIVVPALNAVLNKTRFRAVDATFLARYGLADDLEFDLDIPYLRIDQQTEFLGGGGVQDDDAGLGDVGVGLRYALVREEGVRPDIILSLAARAPTGNVDVGLTGTGSDLGLEIDSWSVGGAVTLVKTVDPVVFFAQAGYTETFEDGDIDPGDQFPYAFGLGFSLNDRISVRAAVVGAYVDEIEISGRKIRDSDLEINSLNFAATGQLSRNLFIEPFVGLGLTEDATDFSMGLNILYTLEGRYPLFGE